MYFIKYGNVYLHDPRSQNLETPYLLYDVKLTGNENSCGYLDFTIYPNHPYYNALQERDSQNPIEVYDNETLLFAGFIYELGKEFKLDGKVSCKGELAYLEETIVRPYSTHERPYGQLAPNTVQGYFEFLINQHNMQVDKSKRFTVGINEGQYLDTNNYIYRQSDSYPTVWEELRDKIIENENLGGKLRIRHVNGVRYIDLLADWTDANTQILDFGVNLTDYTQTDKSDEIYTAILPLGAPISECAYDYVDGYFETMDPEPVSGKDYYIVNEDQPVDPSTGHVQYRQTYRLTEFEAGVTYYEYYSDYDEGELKLTVDDLHIQTNQDKDVTLIGDLVASTSGMNKYGLITKTYSNADIKTKEGLYRNAIKLLKQCLSPVRTIEVKAVDMHIINPNGYPKPIAIGEYVRVRSDPHGFDSYMLCSDISLNLTNPQDSVYTFGTSFDTLTGEQNKNIKKLNSQINKTIEATKDISEEAKSNAINLDDLHQNTLASFAATDKAVCTLYEKTVAEEQDKVMLANAICELTDMVAELDTGGDEE